MACPVVLMLGDIGGILLVILIAPVVIIGWGLGLIAAVIDACAQTLKTFLSQGPF
jgi:flagellar biosynthesis protein FliQ